VVLWRLRYQLSLRDLAEMFLARGLVFSHEAVRDWEAKLAPALAGELRRRRRGRSGKSWYVDETYLRVGGRWCYLYRALDRAGNLVDVRRSERRDLEAARAFFRSAKAVTGVTPARPGHDRRARQLPPRHPKRAGPRRAAPDQRLPERPPRAGPPRHQGPPPADAGLRVGPPRPGGSAVVMTSRGPSCGPDRAAGSMCQPIAGG
jgi:DDE domain